MSDKTDAILKSIEEKTGMKLSPQAKAKLTDKAAIGSLISRLTPSDMAALGAALKSPDGVNALAENTALVQKIKDALEG